MSDSERLYQAVTVAGGESGPMTIQEARDQAEAWNDKGYTAYVEKIGDDSWEDVEVVAPITIHQVADSLGHDRAELERFAKELIGLIGWEIDHQDGGFMVYTSGPEDY